MTAALTPEQQAYLATVAELNTLAELAAIDIQPHVIHSASEKGYWNDEYGWTGIDIASHYYVPPEGRPDSAGVDATLLPLAEALAAGGRGAGA